MSDGNKGFSGATVFVVDDVEANRVILGEIIKSMGCKVILAENGAEALALLEQTPGLPALILSDISMPEVDGFELCRILKENVETREIPLIFISAFDKPKDIIKGFELGGADYITKPFIPEEVQVRVSVHLKLSKATREIKEANRQLQISVQEQLYQIEQERKNVLYALANVAARNSYHEKNYIDRLKYNCRVLVQSMQFSPRFEGQISDSFIEVIELSAPLCDVGNVGIPKDILQKDDYLDDLERKTMQAHAQIGADLLRDLQVTNDYNDFSRISIEIALSHHENWDGSGYPQGLAGEEIPLAAQIVGISSVYCALTEKRPYRDGYSSEEALEIMKKDAEQRYHPEIFRIFCKIAQRLR